MSRAGTVTTIVSRGGPKGDRVEVQWDGTIAGAVWADPALELQPGDRVLAAVEGGEPLRRDSAGAPAPALSPEAHDAVQRLGLEWHPTGKTPSASVPGCFVQRDNGAVRIQRSPEGWTAFEVSGAFPTVSFAVVAYARSVRLAPVAASAPGLTIEHRDGKTVARDEEGHARFTLPGTHGPELVGAVERLLRTARTVAHRNGRESMAHDLRRLLDVPCHGEVG